MNFVIGYIQFPHNLTNVQHYYLLTNIIYIKTI